MSTQIKNFFKLVNILTVLNLSCGEKVDNPEKLDTDSALSEKVITDSNVDIATDNLNQEGSNNSPQTSTLVAVVKEIRDIEVSNKKGMKTQIYLMEASNSQMFLNFDAQVCVENCSKKLPLTEFEGQIEIGSSVQLIGRFQKERGQLVPRLTTFKILSAEESNDSNSDSIVLLGEQLYLDYCSQCHGDIMNSEKSGSSADDIEFQRLKAFHSSWANELPFDAIKAIAAALE